MKIDLEEIEGAVNAIRLRVTQAESDRNSCIMIPKSAASEIATALEQLPKLVTALRGAIEIAAPVDASEVEQLDFAKQALEPFTETQPQP